MSANTERRTNAMLALVIAHQDIENMTNDIAEHMSDKECEDYYEQMLDDYNAAIAEYEAAHAPTADEIKAHLVEHLDTNVSVWFSGGQVTVEVDLKWIENGEVTKRFGSGQDDDYDNQCIGDCC